MGQIIKLSDNAASRIKEIMSKAEKNAIGVIVNNPLRYRMKVDCSPFNPASTNFGTENIRAKKSEATNINDMPLSLRFSGISESFISLLCRGHQLLTSNIVIKLKKRAL